MTSRTLVATLVLLLGVATPKVHAQVDFDRVIGRDEYSRPIVVKALDGDTIGVVARLAGVPMGIEVAQGVSRQTHKPVTLTGHTVSEALELIAALDDRYEMRQMEGVFVLRTREAWQRSDHPLHAGVPPILLPNIRIGNALLLIASFLGAPQSRGGSSLTDTKRFTLDLRAGTVLDLLNATVRAHGEIAWAFESNSPAPSLPYTVTLSAAGGYAVPGVQREPVDVSLYAERPLPPPASSSALADRIVGTTSDDRPVIVRGPFASALSLLGTATKVPMGIEFLGPEYPALGEDISATGRTLRDVLDAIIAVDPRYEWRELPGVIVIRPAVAWRDPDSVLFRLVPAVEMTDTSLTDAVSRVARFMGHPSPIVMPSGTTISLNQPQGTVLDLVNAVVRAHGEMFWELRRETEPSVIQQGYRYVFTFFMMGGHGKGFAMR